MTKVRSTNIDLVHYNKKCIELVYSYLNYIYKVYKVQ